MTEHEDLKTLPGTDREQSWLEERLTTLSEKEKTILSAAVLRQPPETMAEAINHLLSLEDYAGYVLTRDKSAYITQNNREFIYERSAPEEAGMSWLLKCSRRSTPKEAEKPHGKKRKLWWPS